MLHEIDSFDINLIQENQQYFQNLSEFALNKIKIFSDPYLFQTLMQILTQQKLPILKLEIILNQLINSNFKENKLQIMH